MWNQPNPNGPTAVFIARPDGTFRRFDAKTRKAWDAPREQGPIGTYGADGSMYIGVDPRMALDAALDPNAGVPPMRPDRAAAIGREQAAAWIKATTARSAASTRPSLHDLAHKANLPESDMQGFTNVLAALTGGEQGPAARDRLAAAAALDGDQASQIYRWQASKVARRLPKAVELLSGRIRRELQPGSARPKRKAERSAPAFRACRRQAEKSPATRRSRRSGASTGITAGHAPPYGEPVPKSSARREAESARMALDASDARTGGSSARGFQPRMALRRRIGRAHDSGASRNRLRERKSSRCSSASKRDTADCTAQPRSILARSRERDPSARRRASRRRRQERRSDGARENLRGPARAAELRAKSRNRRRRTMTMPWMRSWRVKTAMPVARQGGDD